jgi:hypothetical protein
MSLTKLFLAGNNLIIPGESLVNDIPAGDGKIANLFNSVGRRGVFYSFKRFLPAFAAFRGRGWGQVSTLWRKNANALSYMRTSFLIYDLALDPFQFVHIFLTVYGPCSMYCTALNVPHSFVFLVFTVYYRTRSARLCIIYCLQFSINIFGPFAAE